MMPGLVLLLLLGCRSSTSANTSQSNLPKALRAGIRQDLADRLKISANDVSILHTAGATWRDTGLGCEEPDRGYFAELTGGYRITVQAQGKCYTYDADANKRGDRPGYYIVVLCRDGQPIKKHPSDQSAFQRVDSGEDQ